MRADTTGRLAAPKRAVPALLLSAGLAAFAGVPPERARQVDGGFYDWCSRAASIRRIDDAALRLTCGICDGVTTLWACAGSADCPGGEHCSGAFDEIVWYDKRTDGAVNDLAKIATAQDDFAIYFLVEMWTDSGLHNRPLLQIPIEFRPGGSHDLRDPLGAMTAPGVCSGFTDRACTRDEDCHFCQEAFEPPYCCELGNCAGGELCRVRVCGGGCWPGGCDTSQTCLAVGATPLGRVGSDSNPVAQADYLLAIDFARWVLALEAAVLYRWTGEWSPRGTFVVDAGGGIPEVPLLNFELGIPWSAFGCTNWTAQNGCGANATAASCGCPEFGPGVDFVFTGVVARARLSLDFTPEAGIEDVVSEPIAGMSTWTGDDCPGPGIGTTQCELADGTTDTFAPLPLLPPGGRVAGLTVSRNTVAPRPSVTLTWNPSCSSGDTDYSVYEGDLASLPSYDQEPVLCSTAGATTSTFDAEAGNRYYLVVPTDGTEEGSYGLDGTKAQRPSAAAPCRNQVAAFVCP